MESSGNLIEHKQMGTQRWGIEMMNEKMKE
jgi:hypothetical protein